MTPAHEAAPAGGPPPSQRPAPAPAATAPAAGEQPAATERARDRTRRRRERQRAAAHAAEPPGGGAIEQGTILRGPTAAASSPTWRQPAVPTATCFREVPARLLEVNRSILTNYLQRTRGGKVSFTHIIGYAVVRAIADACR